MKFNMFYPTDVPNKNGNIFPHDVVKKAFDEWKDKNGLGTLQCNAYLGGEIDLEMVSHRIESVEEVEGGFQIFATILDTPKGDELRERFERHLPIRFGLNGFGILDAYGICTELELVSVDALFEDDEGEVEADGSEVD